MNEPIKAVCFGTIPQVQKEKGPLRKVEKNSKSIHPMSLKKWEKKR